MILQIQHNITPTNTGIYFHTNKTNTHASIAAYHKAKQIGHADLTKSNDRWKLNSYSIIDEYKGTLDIKMMSKIKELEQELTATSDAILGVLSYFEKD